MKGTVVKAAAAAGGLGAAREWLRRRNPYDFTGKVVLLTGGSRGLGLLIARELAGQGARLALAARDAGELEQAAADLRDGNAEVRVYPCDVRVQAEVQNMVEKVIADFGALDVLVNNAGVIQVGPADNMRVADYEDAMAIHLWAPLYTMLAALPQMRKAGGGRIVNIASIGGKIAVPHLAPYSASKFALVGLSDALRAELAGDNIRITTVSPGLMRTGSVFNAYFKGRYRAEFSLFSIIGSSRLFTIDAGRAARQIVDACRFGDPELTISVQAQVLARANALFPRLTAGTLALVSRVLPAPAGREGDVNRSGWAAHTKVAPSPLTGLSNEAALANNEARGHEDLLSGGAGDLA